MTRGPREAVVVPHTDSEEVGGCAMVSRASSGPFRGPDDQQHP